MKMLLLLLMLVSAGIIEKATAQIPAVVLNDKNGWHKIGNTTVSFKNDHDEILILGSNRFVSIKFKVTDAPIDLENLEIYFRSGDKQVVQFRMSFEAPGESRVIDLNGGERTVKKIVFKYRTLPNYKDVKAHVEVWGLKENSDKK